jgi:two-component system cell cycle sensor histidine kinase/response regulator CckA
MLAVVPLSTISVPMPIPFIHRSSRNAFRGETFGGRSSSAAAKTAVQTELVQRVIDAIDALVVVASPNCSLWLWNARCDATSGVPLSEVTGKPLWSVMRLRPNPSAVAQAAFDRLISGQERSVEFQSQWLRKDGRKARISWTARVVDVGDEYRFVVATGTETTRGRKVAHDMAETESRFETLLELLPDPVVIHQNGEAVFVNRAAVEMYGAKSPEDVHVRPVIEWVAPESRPKVLARIARMLAQGESVPMEQERHLKLDGTPFDVEVVAAPVTFDGRPAVELVARDITARKETEAALRASEARVRAVFDQSSLGMLVVDKEGTLIESNAAFRRLTGHSAAELRRLTVADLTHPADREATTRLLGDLFAGRNDGYEIEKRYIAKDGREIWVRLHVSPVGESPGVPTLAVGTVEDISEHEILEEQLRQASKMEALGRLAAGVAHDFNNLLTVVNGYADMLATSLQGDERAADAIEIRQAGARAAELTAQLLAFGRRSKRALEPVGLNGRIEAMVPMMKRLLGEDVEFRVKLDGTCGTVAADPSQFDQLVMNLVVNARDAMPGGGTLTVSTSCLTSSESPGHGPDATWARLEIADTGIGMGPDVLEHIFEPFFTTKGQGQGTGLGLATVYGVVQQMGGRVRVESTVGVGSRFTVELPLCEPSAQQPATADTEAVEVGRANETILLVEDEPAVRDFCKRALGGEGYRVHLAGPHDALEVAASLGPELDLLVTDVVMPDFDGPTIAAALRSRRRDLKVLFMSGYPRDREDDLTGAAAEGAILVKPFSPRELCDAVRRALDRPAPSA